MSETEWWRAFFTGPVVELWLGATTDEQTRSEVDFAESALGAAAPAEWLDVPCGGGRHAIELAARGHRVVGVDGSVEFLRAGRLHASGRNLDVTWEQRDMRDLPWLDRFDGAICLGNSFGYLDHDDNAVFLSAVARSLKPGGRFVLETGIVAESIFPTIAERTWYPVEGFILLADRRYHPRTGRIEVDYTFVRDGSVETRRASQQVYLFRELCTMLECAGFCDIDAFGSLEREPFRLGSQNLLLTATRAKDGAA